MSHVPETLTVPDEQVSLALARVHGRIRRRRTVFRSAGAAALACVAFLGVGVATQQQAARTPQEGDAYAPGGWLPTEPAPEPNGACGQVLAAASASDLELAIQGPVEWPVLRDHFGPPQEVIVSARNTGTSPVTLMFPGRVVGLGEEEVVVAEAAAPVLMPTAVTLAPSDVVELPAALPVRSCTGDDLGAGTHTIAPVVALEGEGHELVAVRGPAVTVVRR